ncbi:HD-GYP domain-containing protein [Cellulosilyticum sp. I15G10I2]|uniref:HD-GYP domain-containing protein n=1 Tax=Cellulosilyticum sp. I15G10I2 TaxID=1892843 RepID=UPI00085BD00D|nr:HD-GYP domain-containing protein [Cellulosilyticum sp. I15G10I2]
MFYKISKLFRVQHVHDVIECLTAALEAKDIYTSGHSSRVAAMSFDLARSMGIKGVMLEDIHIAAHLHDIGKMGVPENILNKKGKLLPHEWTQIQRHPEIGYAILSKSRQLDKIAEMVLYHHERWDGKGYPHALKKDKIPLGSRIIAVADGIDAMTSARPYREAMSWEDCMEEVLLNKELQFDPVVVEAALRIWKKWEYQPKAS